MPYTWTDTPPSADETELRLWPHQSLPPYGFAAAILGAFLLGIIPLFGLIGTVLLWGLLPYLMLAIAGMWWGLRRNARDRDILEVLQMDEDEVHLTRRNPKGDTQEWTCNRYWTKVEMHEDGGPVPHYVTLSGSGRQVEIGSFLSEDERKTLYSDLLDRLRQSPTGR